MKLEFQFIKHLPKETVFVLILTLVFTKSLSTHCNAQNLNIVATIKPIHSLVSMVTGSVENPTLLVQGTASPHTYALKPSDAKKLNSAKIIFRVSDNIEPFLTKILSSLPSSVKVVTLSQTQGLTLLKYRSGETFEADLHTDEDHEHTHKDEANAHSDLNESPKIDGHIWLDPDNAIVILKEINRILKEIAPENAVAFEENTARAISDIQKTKRTISNILTPLHGKSYVVFHDAFHYFEKRFNFPAVGSITVSPELQLSGKRIKQIRDKIIKLKTFCVFSEPIANPKILENILEGTNAKVGSLDPEGLLINSGPSAYLDIMNGIADNLQSCLK